MKNFINSQSSEQNLKNLKIMKNQKSLLRTIAIALCLAGISSISNAQWTRNAATQQTYLTNTGDNVGIGTTNPQFKLDIQSNSAASMSFKSTTGNSNIIIDRANSASTSGVNYRTNGVPFWQTGTIGTDNYVIRNVSLGATAFAVNFLTNNVGIGTTSPVTRLHVVGDGRIQGNLQVTNNSSFGASMNVSGNITATGTLTAGGNVFFGDTINFGSAENFYDGGANTIVTNDNLNVQQTLSVGTITSGASTLNVTGTATITNGLTVSNGINVVTGNIASGGDLYTTSVNGVINCGGDSMSALINVMADGFTPGTSNLNANGDEDLYIGGDLEVVGKGYQSGGGAWGVRSDRRLKKDIVDFNDGLEQLMKIHPVKFKYNDLFPNHTEKEYVGIIAQEMQEIAPYMVEELPMGQIVQEDANGKEVIINPGKNYLTFDPNALWYITVNAIKEQQSIIEKQEARIAALEAKLNMTGSTERKSNSNLSTYRLSQNTPNPFNQSTTINFSCGDATQAQIIIRDLNGNLIKSINAVGKTQVTINANELTQGTYTYTLEVNGASIDTKLMVMTK